MTVKHPCARRQPSPRGFTFYMTVKQCPLDGPGSADGRGAGTAGGRADRGGPLRRRRQEPADHPAHACAPRVAFSLAAATLPALAAVWPLHARRASLLPVDGARRGLGRGRAAGGGGPADRRDRRARGCTGTRDARALRGLLCPPWALTPRRRA